MSKFWMMGVAAIAVTVAIVALDSRPVRSSEDSLGKDLLGKAQSEFAIKARDALVQRRMVQASTAQASTAPELASALPSVPQSPYKVASLEPVAPPTIVAPQAVVSPVAPVSPPATVETPEAPVASRELPAVTKTEDKQPTEPQVVSLPGSPAIENAVTPKPAPTVAVKPVLTTVTAKGVSPTGGTRRESAKGTRQAQRVSNAPRMKTAVRRSEPYASRNSMPYGIESLRARAPEIAAAIARYM